jgi:integrase
LSAEILSTLISFSEWARKHGYREHTILASIGSLKSIARHSSLLNPNHVLEYIANAPVTESRKQKLSYDYLRFCKFKGIDWIPPKFNPVFPLPFVPRDEDLTELISGMGPKMAAFLQIMRETACRAGEAWQLQWHDVDQDGNLITITAEKGSYSGQYRISNRCLALINQLPNLGRYLFHADNADPILSLVYARRVFQRRRKRLAERLCNPKLNRISFRTLRTWKASREYARTRDIIYVKEKILRHRSISSTMHYVRLAENITDDDYSVRVASSQNEISELIEAGYEFILQKDGMAYFRKRK